MRRLSEPGDRGRRKTSKEVWPGVTAAPPGTNSWQLSWPLDEDSEAFISEVRFTTETTELRRAEPSALSGTKKNTERCDLTQNIPAPTFYSIFQVEVWIRALGCSHLSRLVLDILRNDFVTFSKSSEASDEPKDKPRNVSIGLSSPLSFMPSLHCRGP